MDSESGMTPAGVLDSQELARAYSQDLRDRVIKATQAGFSARKAAARFAIGAATAIAWVNRQRETGENSAYRQGRPRGSKLEEHRTFVVELIEAEPDLTITELQERLLRDRGLHASTGTIWTFLDRCGLTFKKKSAYAAEHDRADVLQQRVDWFEAQLDLDPDKLVFVDESFASTQMARLHGRALKGQRLRAPIPQGSPGRRPRSSLGCGAAASRPPGCSMDRSPVKLSWPMCATCWCRRSRPATSSSPTICRATRATRCARRLRPRARHFSSCRRTVRSSIRSSVPSPS